MGNRSGEAAEEKERGEGENSNAKKQNSTRGLREILNYTAAVQQSKEPGLILLEDRQTMCLSLGAG